MSKVETGEKKYCRLSHIHETIISTLTKSSFHESVAFNSVYGGYSMTTHFFSGGTTISGAQLASTIANMASLGGIGHQVLKSFGISEIEPEKYYPFQIRRSIHDTILRRFGPEALYSFGFGYGDSWVHIHEALYAFREEWEIEGTDEQPWLATEQAIDMIGGMAFSMMNDVLKKNSHGEIYYGAWITRLGHGHYRAELRNTSALTQEAFLHGLFVNFFWTFLSDYWSFKVSFDPTSTKSGDEWTHFVWGVHFTPHRSNKTALELTWEHRLAAREALLGRVLAESEQKHQHILDSVNYASRLQRGQLPRQERIEGRYSSFTSIWEPRDTIGGDLYWLSSSQELGPFVLAVADCTGHGVPGAMLSLLVSNSLERIYANDTGEDPATALMSLDHYVRTGLNQDRPDSESDDGCDAAVLRIDPDKKTIEFAGAKLGLFQVSAQGEATRHQGSRCSLGYQEAVAEIDKPVLQKIPYQSGDVFAVVTDGFTDQIGGATGKTSFGYRRLEDILKANCAASTDEIAAAMKLEFANWQGTNARRDDVTAVVFRL